MPSKEEEEEQDDSCLFLLAQELRASVERNHSLEKENELLKQEVARLKSQIASLKSHGNDRKSSLWKKLQTSNSCHNNELQAKKPTTGAEAQLPTPEEIIPCSTPQSPQSGERTARVPKPPPRPSFAKLQLTIGKSGVIPPPPPPPVPSKLQGGYAKTAVRRVPEVVELYRALARRETGVDPKTGISGISPTTGENARNMIGEIENRSAYLSAIKSDVETQGPFIELLSQEVENARYSEIHDVEAFVRWLDGELSYLVDERAVLKHFPQWPERKADAMREAACTYRDMRNLEMEVLSFHDNPHQPLSIAFKRMQTLQDKLERSVHDIERTREMASKRYKDLHIPWQWMLDTGTIGELKHSSMRLAKQYMNRVIVELKRGAHPNGDHIILQAVRFAFRVHQFMGGFNAETEKAFQQLTEATRSYHSACYGHPDNLPMLEPVYGTSSRHENS